MDWFSILKNQMASTKGKQFQLDFSQPMVEDDDDCKRKLIKLYEKFKNNWDNISKPLENSIGGRVIEQNLKGELSSVSEEVCCEVIRLWNELQYGITEVTLDGYYVRLYKQVTSGYFDNRVVVYTGILIDRRNLPETIYSVGFSIKTDKVEKETDEFIDTVEEWTNREMSL